MPSNRRYFIKGTAAAIGCLIAARGPVAVRAIRPPAPSREPPGVSSASTTIHLPLALASGVSPSNNWDFALGSAAVVPNGPGVPIYPWYPDGHISVLQDGPGSWTMYWAGYESYRSTGTSPFPEDQTALSPATKVLGGRGGSNWDNGGAWLMSVARLSGNNLVGFYHAEDHWNPPNPQGLAWKSMAVTYSSDNGVTWSPGQQVITAWKTKPPDPAWGGAGDHSVIWDSIRSRWACYYQEQVDNGEAQIHMAVSFGWNGAPGTWYK